MRKLTPKQRVLSKYPMARSCYVGLSLKIVIAVGMNTKLSGQYSRERDAWADAARRLATPPPEREGAEMSEGAKRRRK